MHSPFDSLSDSSTLGGVLVGGAVATLGAFAASWYERRVFRREREADAALVFGELLGALAIRIAVMRAAHARGDPFGPITIRMARGVRQEVDIYDRNRERLFFVRDAALRPRVSTLMGRLTFALDRILDNSDALAGHPTEVERQELTTGREQAFEFLIQSADELPAIIKRFAALTHLRVSAFDLENVGFGPPTREEG